MTSLVPTGYSDKNNSTFFDVAGLLITINYVVVGRKRLLVLPGSVIARVEAKIGAGAQPLKTRYGWLLITHGVDHARIYRLGVMLLHLTDPTIVLYRSPNCILEPREPYEVGEPGVAWVPNVVFTCGALPLGEEKEILDQDDEILVYYGASDAVIGVARARVSDLITRKFM